MGIDNLEVRNVESSLCLEGWNYRNSITGEALKNFIVLNRMLNSKQKSRLIKRVVLGKNKQKG